VTDYWEQHLARVRGHELVKLRLHWDEAYKISWDGVFRAARLDDGTSLEAHTARELWELMRDDYSERHVKYQP